MPKINRSINGRPCNSTGNRYSSTKAIPRHRIKNIGGGIGTAAQSFLFLSISKPLYKVIILHDIINCA
jgi:hypothetical protein